MKGANAMRLPPRAALFSLLPLFLFSSAGCGAAYFSGGPAGSDERNLALYHLRFAPQKRHPYKLAVNAEMRIQTSALGTEIDMEQKTHLKALVQFKGNGPKASSAEYTFFETSVEPNVWATFPLPPDALSPVIDIYNFLSGQSFRTDLDGSGRALELRGLRDMTEGLHRRVELPERARPVADMTVQRALGEEPLIETIAQLYPYLPVGVMEPGAEWEASLAVQGFAVKARCVLIKREDGAAHIEVNGVFLPAESRPFNIPGVSGLETEYTKLDGSYKAVYILEEASGIALHFTIEMTADAALRLKKERSAGQSGETKPISVRFHSKMSGSHIEPEEPEPIGPARMPKRLFR